ncbi:hypothetical protein LTS06_012422, partial [Exophiala xenobiotica]
PFSFVSILERRTLIATRSEIGQRILQGKLCNCFWRTKSSSPAVRISAQNNRACSGWCSASRERFWRRASREYCGQSF